MEFLKKIFKEVGTTDENYQAHLKKAKQLMDSRFYDRASVEYSKALQANALRSIPIVKRQFEDAESTGGLDLLSLGQSLLVSFPDNPELANFLGNLCRRHSQPRQAENYYKHALKVNPEYDWASYNLAATLAHSCQYDENAKLSISVFEVRSNFVLPLFEDELAKLIDMEFNGKFAAWKATKDAVEDAAKLDPETKAFDQPEPKRPKSPKEPGQLFSKLKSQWMETQSLLDKEEPFKLICALGYQLLSQNQPVSFKIFEWAVQRNPLDANLRCFLFCSLALKQPKIAVEKLIALLAKVPNHRYALINLGLAYRRADNIQLSRRYLFLGFEMLRRSQGRYEVAGLFDEAKILLKNNPRKAWELLQDLRLDMTKAEQLLQLGALSLGFKEWNPAQSCFREVLLKDPKNRQALDGMRSVREEWLTSARIAAEKNNWQESVMGYQLVISVEADEEVLEEALEVARGLGNHKTIREFEREISLQKQKDRLVVANQHLERAMMLEGNRQGAAAIQEYQQSLVILPQHKVFVQMLDCCRKFRLDSHAEQLGEWFEKVQEANPEEVIPRLEIA
jgi:hypothetical protein